jgi:hypothetical protein
MERSMTARVLAGGAALVVTVAMVGMLWWTSDAYAAKAAPIDWSVAMDCTGCHTTEGSSFEVPAEKDGSELEASYETPDQNDADADLELLASRHAGIECLTCHSDVEELEDAHDGITAKTRMPKRLKETHIDEAVCLDCHQSSWEELVEATVDSTALVDKEGTVVNPHEAPELTAAHEQEGMTCGSCHSMHIDRDVQTYCGTCHHMEVYACGTCHG